MAKGVCRASFAALSGHSGADSHSNGKERGFTSRNPIVYAVIAPAVGSVRRVNRPEIPGFVGPCPERRKPPQRVAFGSGPCRSRTYDLGIKSPLLYQLS